MAKFRQRAQPLNSRDRNGRLAKLHGAANQMQMRKHTMAALHQQPIVRFVERVFGLRMEFIARRALEYRQQHVIDRSMIAAATSGQTQFAAGQIIGKVIVIERADAANRQVSPAVDNFLARRLWKFCERAGPSLPFLPLAAIERRNDRDACSTAENDRRKMEPKFSSDSRGWPCRSWHSTSQSFGWNVPPCFSPWQRPALPARLIANPF